MTLETICIAEKESARILAGDGAVDDVGEGVDVAVVTCPSDDAGGPPED